MGCFLSTLQNVDGERERESEFKKMSTSRRGRSGELSQLRSPSGGSSFKKIVTSVSSPFKVSTSVRMSYDPLQSSPLKRRGSILRGFSITVTPKRGHDDGGVSLATSLGSMLDQESGKLSRHGHARMSSVHNCEILDGEGPAEYGATFLRDYEEGVDIRIVRQIGKGGYGRVYLGYSNGKRVAVKAVFGEKDHVPLDDVDLEVITVDRRESMVQFEALLMFLLTGHPNIVQTHKCLASRRDMSTAEGLISSVQYEWFIIMEYCAQGSLWEALSSGDFHTDQASEQRLCDNEPESEPSVHYILWDAWACLEILKEVVRALSFLHDNDVIHGDIKAGNVLLADKDLDRRGYIAKLTDFGFSRVTPGSHLLTKRYGTVTHQPPELLSGGVLSRAADVYAFGALMWETYTAESLFKTLNDEEVIAAVVKEGLRPKFPSGCPSPFVELANLCLSDSPEQRPSSQEVEQMLETVQSCLCPLGQYAPLITVPGYTPAQRRRLRALSKLPQVVPILAAAQQPNQSPSAVVTSTELHAEQPTSSPCAAEMNAVPAPFSSSQTAVRPLMGRNMSVKFSLPAKTSALQVTETHLREGFRLPGSPLDTSSMMPGNSAPDNSQHFSGICGMSQSTLAVSKPQPIVPWSRTTSLSAVKITTDNSASFRDVGNDGMPKDDGSRFNDLSNDNESKGVIVIPGATGWQDPAAAAAASAHHSGSHSTYLLEDNHKFGKDGGLPIEHQLSSFRPVSESTSSEYVLRRTSSTST
ncbi:hypothetical protein CEUSTIGMA_g12493.t1 [Chlamydomonas eustigma]|uniref:Protein kinase domain-containing protein n=1 Tax=Chlamydomonas eustigma TaxID=1157962 RepID=A0A250XPZ0_9CHLO|nr:hypothetical protein CEUSTIGMA_g12493.t1 [Chlamydomonas eustigma]|eukprot:GAX85073.1 hypothetical protein CEUSTIGMA_g12493.t1 [Chlamydomonas eustigma]